MTFIKLHICQKHPQNNSYTVGKEYIVPINSIVLIRPGEVIFDKDTFPMEERHPLPPSSVGNVPTVITLSFNDFGHNETFFVCESIDYICKKISKSAEHSVL